MPRIIINSNPRTGMSRLLEFARIAYNRTNNKKFGEYSNRKDFIIWTHVPFMLLSEFKDVLQITIVRNPDDVIPSICDKLDSGVGLDVHDNQITYHNPNSNLFQSRSEYLSHSVNSASLEYLSYLDNIKNNFNNILVFSFEQVINNIELVIDTIAKSFDEEYKSFTKEQVLEIDDLIHKKWKTEENENLLKSNRGPSTNKSESYYNFKETFINSEIRNELQKSYTDVLKQIKNL
jgi:hypothetical protein